MNNPVEYIPPTLQLSQEHQRLCQNTLRFIQDMRPLMDKAEACKVDCSKYEQLRVHLRHINEQLVKNFCVPPPTIHSP